MDLEDEYDEETINYFYEECDIEKIFSQLSRILREINKIVPGSPENTKNIGRTIMTIFNDIDKNCLVRLSSFLIIQLPAAANQMTQLASFGNARRCIPHINKVLSFLKDEFYMTDEEEDENENENVGTQNNENQNMDSAAALVGGKRKNIKRKTKNYRKKTKRTNKKRSNKRRTHKRKYRLHK